MCVTLWNDIVWIRTKQSGQVWLPPVLFFHWFLDRGKIKQLIRQSRQLWSKKTVVQISKEIEVTEATGLEQLWITLQIFHWGQGQVELHTECLNSPLCWYYYACQLCFSDWRNSCLIANSRASFPNHILLSPPLPPWHNYPIKIFNSIPSHRCHTLLILCLSM